MLTKLVSWSKEISPPMAAMMTATIQRAACGVELCSSSLLKNFGKSPSRPME